MLLLNLLIIALLIILTGFFVAIEFAIVKVRVTKINSWILKGKKGAVSAKKVVTHLDEYLSTCQLGITVTSLILGWLGEPTVEKLFYPLFAALYLDESISKILSVGLGFISVTFLSVVIGELTPKTIAIQKAEALILFLSMPIIWFNKMMFPFIWVLNRSARFLAHLVGFQPATEQELAHTEEELRLILAESYKNGQINQSEFQYLNNIFDFNERMAKEIMVPRTEISSVTIDDTIRDVLNRVKTDNYTRYPVIEEDIDTIIGVINVKALVTAEKANKDQKIESIMTPVIRVIETVPIQKLLVKMQKEGTHMAILLDEYGGTSGLVTVEDIIEEIVGEVRDEFDQDEVEDIRKINKNHYLLDAKVLIKDVNHQFNIKLSDEKIDTIGGWFMTQNYDIKRGAEVEAEGYVFKVYDLDGYHILYLEVKKVS
ncbi:hemolysin family protein [Bacillus sp. EB600]|uniref:hemolysin family protein n=1 Tax=Bacillus sp. EB600 TaxID=2806345 RepID=UPI00210D0270|nr:hemolysin family protein [Bacillus sp. EB600]MCQ6282753.1 HlyC/CorC family transporter [Bacillus sp. EB600]